MIDAAELDQLRARAEAANLEMTTYGIAWDHTKRTPPAPPLLWGTGVGVMVYADFRARAFDCGPLSYWAVDQQATDQTWKQCGGGDVTAYELGCLEATECLIKLLDERARAAAEALKEQEPQLMGVTMLPFSPGGYAFHSVAYTNNTETLIPAGAPVFADQVSVEPEPEPEEP